jgi:hypothetical protein
VEGGGILPSVYTYRQSLETGNSLLPLGLSVRKKSGKSSAAVH